MVQKLSLGFGHKLIFQQDETNFVKIINKSGQVTQEWKSEQWRDLPEVTMSEILHSIFLTHYPLPSVPKRIAPNNNTIKHLKEISIEEFLSHICDSRYKQINSDGKKIVNIKEYQISRYMQPSKTYKVRVYSQRYLVFKNNLTCVVCGLKGEKVYLDQEKKNCNNAHFNLYGVENGQLVLMTKDHIIPKARGGKNYLQNYQTMCCICNNLKSNTQLDNNRIFSNASTIRRAMYTKGDRVVVYLNKQERTGVIVEKRLNVNEYFILLDGLGQGYWDESEIKLLTLTKEK